jgi:hypothetical protein
MLTIAEFEINRMTLCISLDYIRLGYMDWVIEAQESHEAELALLRKMTQVTLYDHNQVLTTNP